MSEAPPEVVLLAAEEFVEAVLTFPPDKLRFLIEWSARYDREFGRRHQSLYRADWGLADVKVYPVRLAEETEG